MKLPKHERIEYKCDKCKRLFKYNDMYDNSVCYGCHDIKVFYGDYNEWKID